jgi:hypothetical protein
LYGHIAELEQQVEDYENKLASGVHTCSNTCKRPMCVLRREKEALQQQVEALQWISVEERLPENGSKCLAYLLSTSKEYWKIVVLRKVGEPDNDWRLDGRELANSWDVTHWMPLPEPPQE